MHNITAAGETPLTRPVALHFKRGQWVSQQIYSAVSGTTAGANAAGGERDQDAAFGSIFIIHLLMHQARFGVLPKNPYTLAVPSILNCQDLRIALHPVIVNCSEQNVWGTDFKSINM